MCVDREEKKMERTHFNHTMEETTRVENGNHIYSMTWTRIRWNSRSASDLSPWCERRPETPIATFKGLLFSYFRLMMRNMNSDNLEVIIDQLLSLEYLTKHALFYEQEFSM